MKKENEFKQYLTLCYGGHDYGFIGEETPIKDANGTPLKVGDVVRFNTFDQRTVIAPIVHTDDKYFAMGIGLAFNDDGTIWDDNFTIIKVYDYLQIKHGDVITLIRYVKEEN